MLETLLLAREVYSSENNDFLINKKQLHALIKSHEIVFLGLDLSQNSNVIFNKLQSYLLDTKHTYKIAHSIENQPVEYLLGRMEDQEELNFDSFTYIGKDKTLVNSAKSEGLNSISFGIDINCFSELIKYLEK